MVMFVCLSLLNVFVYVVVLPYLLRHHMSFEHLLFDHVCVCMLSYACYHVHVVIKFAYYLLCLGYYSLSCLGLL